METDESIRRMAMELEEFDLLGRISHGDLIAIEAKYHLKCLIALKNRYRSLKTKIIASKSNNDIDEQMDESVAFIELVEYMEQDSQNSGK